jgi:hypothetical protein
VLKEYLVSWRKADGIFEKIEKALTVSMYALTYQCRCMHSRTHLAQF